MLVSARFFNEEPPAPRTRREKAQRRAHAVSDRAAVERAFDVERHFQTAMADLRGPTRSPDAADDAHEERWKDVARDGRGVDGTPTRANEDLTDSFFDDGGIDIRTRAGRPARKQRGGKGRARPQLSAPAAERPDVLQLAGTAAARHASAVDGERPRDRQAALADEVEQDQRGRPFGDAPLQVVDMVQERMGELEAGKIAEARTETFLPRRLKLASDAELRARRERQQKRLAASPTALADGGGDAVAEQQRRRRDEAALRLLDSAEHLLPGGAGLAADVFAPSARSAIDAAAASLGAGDEVARASPGAAPDGRIPLLRTLPRAGFSSRREAVTAILAGDVKVNGVVERDPFRLVSAADDIHPAGHPQRLRFAPPRLWVYHKPSNVVVSRADPAGRALFTKHAAVLGVDHIIPVGSLPVKAHGVLLLTNDGELARFLEHPRSGIQRTYALRVRPAIGPVLAHQLNTEGVRINGAVLRNIEFRCNPTARSRFSVTLKIRGEAMPVAHLMQHLGRTVVRGGRTSFGSFVLGGLAPGTMREVPVPPFYLSHAGSVWKPFIERDWPYFRRLRVARLRRLSRFRELKPREMAELDAATFDEVRDALRVDAQELADEAERVERLLRAPRPAIDGPSLPPFTDGDVEEMGDHDGDSASPEEQQHMADFDVDNAIVEDVVEALRRQR